MTCPKPTGVLDPACVPRILCIMGDTYFCILFSWSKLGTPCSCSVQTEHPSASSPPGFGICAQPTWARSFNPQSGILGTFLRKWIVTQLVCVTFSIPWWKVLNCILSEKKRWIYPCFGKKRKDWVLQSWKLLNTEDSSWFILCVGDVCLWSFITWFRLIKAPFGGVTSEQGAGGMEHSKASCLQALPYSYSYYSW